MVFSARRANGFRLERIQASRQYADGGFMNNVAPAAAVVHGLEPDVPGQGLGA